MLDLFADKKDKILVAETYKEFREALITSRCAKCALAAGRTHIVADRGNPAAKVMIIGEAPGQNEDLQGRAFVGRAGRLLDALLLELGFDTDRYSLIVNVVKCRPPANRAPAPKEAAACFPFLRKQIELVKPKVILLLGATALKHLVAEKRGFAMADQVGKFFDQPEYPGIRFMALYHPAYILRDMRRKPVMLEHLKHFMTYWERMRQPAGT